MNGKFYDLQQSSGARQISINRSTSKQPSKLDEQSLGGRLVKLIMSNNIRGPVRQVPPNSVLYRTGDPNDWICLIRDGWVKSLTVSSQGKWCVLNLEGPGSILGLPKNCCRERSEDVISKTDVSFSVIPKDDFERLLSSGELGEVYIKHLVRTINDHRNMLTSFVTLDSARRLAVTLVNLAHRWGVNRNGRVSLFCPLTNEELGQMVGTTRSRVGLFLNSFRSSGLIVKKQSFLLLDIEGLNRYADS